MDLFVGENFVGVSNVQRFFYGYNEIDIDENLA